MRCYSIVRLVPDPGFSSPILFSFFLMCANIHACKKVRKGEGEPGKEGELGA